MVLLVMLHCPALHNLEATSSGLLVVVEEDWQTSAVVLLSVVFLLAHPEQTPPVCTCKISKEKQQ